MKPYIICSRDPLKHPVGYTSMQMHMPVERRAKPVLKRDRAKPGTGLPGTVLQEEYSFIGNKEVYLSLLILLLFFRR